MASAPEHDDTHDMTEEGLAAQREPDRDGDADARSRPEGRKRQGSETADRSTKKKNGGGDQDKSNGRADDEGKEDGNGEEDGKKKPSPLRKPWVRVLLVLVLLAVIAGGAFYGWHYWKTGRFFQSTNDAYVKADQVQVATQVSGDIAQIFVAENQSVAAGDNLIQIGDASYRAKVDGALAQIAQARADEAEARAELNKQPSQIAEAQAQLDMGEANLRFAQGEVDRYKPLAASGAETKEKLAQLTSQRDQDAAQVASYSAQLDAQKLTTPSLQAKVAQAQASIQQAQAQVEEAEIDLGDTLIKAPISGRIGDLTARAGQYAQAGMQLLTVVPVQDIYLEANFKETQLGLMRIGQPATIYVDALPKEPLRGKVLSFSPGTGAEFSLIPPQNATGNFTKVVQRVPVKISIEAGPDARVVLVPGLSVTVEVDTRSARNFTKEEKQEEEQDQDAAKAQATQ